MADSSSSSLGAIQAAFSPRIALFPSSQAEQHICTPNNISHFHSLLDPFHIIPRVTVRHANYATATLDALALSFTQNQPEQPFTTPHTIPKPSDQPTSPARPPPATRIRIKHDHHWLGPAEEEEADYPQPPTPWYSAFLARLLAHRPLLPHDHASHPLAAILIASTSHPDPLQEFAALHQRAARDGPGWPSHHEWLETGTILRYYLLIHPISPEEPDGGVPRAAGLLDALKRIYGLNCGLLCFNSENTEWLRRKRIVDHPPGDPQPSPTTQHDYWAQNNGAGQLISHEDILALKLLLREFTLQSLIPHIERCVQQWNDSLAANRKGITGRLFSAGYKYFSKAPGSATSSSSTPEHRYNPTTCSYPHQSQEAQTRRLADFSFMLGDYKFASQMYDYLRKDAFNDQAWPYYSSATQMIGLCTLLQSSISQRSKLDIDLQRFLFDHTQPTASISHLRIVMIYYEMAKSFGNPSLMASSLIRVATTGQYDDLTSGLIYEQVARIVPPRQAALYSILAAHRYASAEQNWLSKVCLQQAPQFVGWPRIEDYVDHKMALTAELDADWPAALVRYWNVLRRRILSGAGDADDDELYLDKFRALYPRAIEANPSLELPRIEDISLFDVERCKIRVPHQNHLRAYPDIDPAVWEELGARCPGTPGVTNTPNEPSTAVVNEPFYLDLRVRNPLQTSIHVTQIQIQVADPSSDPSSNLEIDPVDDLELLPLESREVSVKLTCKQAAMRVEITDVKFRFDSLIACSQAMKKKGKRLQATLAQRLGREYTNDQSMVVRVRAEVPIVEIIGAGSLPMTIYDGESCISRISIRNTGLVGLTHLQAVVSHTYLFRFCADPPPLSDVLYETSGDDPGPDPLVIEVPNHVLPEPPALLAQDLKEGQAVDAALVCRGEGVGHHATCWLFVFRHATSGELLSFRHVQHLSVLPSLSIKPAIRPSLTPDAFYLLTLELDCLALPEDIEIYQVSMISTHWTSKWLNGTPGSPALLRLPKGASSVTLAFEIHPRTDAVQDDPTTHTMLEQLAKLLKKEPLDEAPMARSSVRPLVSLAHPIAQPCVRLDAPTLLDTILTSDRAARRKALASHFTSLSGAQIGSIFPWTTAGSASMVVFWRATGTGKQGHHQLSGLRLGASLDRLHATLARGAGTAGGMYRETQVLHKTLLAQLRASEFGASQDPVAVHVSLAHPVAEWDFATAGPTTVPVTFTLKNQSPTRPAAYELVLAGATGGLDAEGRAGWTGKLAHRGRLAPLKTAVVLAGWWLCGPGVVDGGRWTCRASYLPALSSSSDARPLSPAPGLGTGRGTDQGDVEKTWTSFGRPVVCSVAAAGAGVLAPDPAPDPAADLAADPAADAAPDPAADPAADPAPDPAADPAADDPGAGAGDTPGSPPIGAPHPPGAPPPRLDT
ncbi:hypothetical protein PtB15_3B96 [Puccinia triticina]|nr:hypothetical protein PtB15_3B96 [Puccinia triticina]